MRRGDIVIAAAPGDYGKPRPALVVQSDAFAAIPSVTVLPITSALSDRPLLRVRVSADPATGLRRPSEVMVDKPVTLPRAKIGGVAGRLDAATFAVVEARLAEFLGFNTPYES